MSPLYLRWSCTHIFQKTLMSTLKSGEVGIGNYVIIDQIFKKLSHDTCTSLPDVCASLILSPLIINKVTRTKCPHGKQAKTRCAECLGHPVQRKIVKKCPHNLIKSRCEVCVGHPVVKQKQAPFCVHGRQKCRCIECLGVCPHGIGKWRCVECGATARKPQKRCSHGRVNRQCIDCIGVCPHGIGKWKCVECGAAARKARKRCQHDKLMTSQCKQCQALGGVIKKRIYKNCEHNMSRNCCKICRLKDICPHQKRRCLCRECGGKSFCDCDGGKMKNVCPKHGGSALCVNCIQWPDPQQKNKLYGNYCARCFTNKWPDDPKSQQQRRKIKENRIKAFLEDNQIPFVNDKAVLDRDTSCDKSASRPDFQLQHAHQELVSIHIEVDENQHSSYENTCELVRLNDIAISYQFRRPLVFLRYNPDPFNVGGQRITCKDLPRKEKEAILLRELKHVMKAAAHPETFPALLRVITIGYDCDCGTATECGFVHSTDYPDQESIRQAYNLMQ